MTTVKPGQIWADGTNAVRYVHVVEVDSRYVHVERVSSSDGWRTVVKSGRRSRVLLDRFRDRPTTTGYHLVRDAGREVLAQHDVEETTDAR